MIEKRILVRESINILNLNYWYPSM